MEKDCIAAVVVHFCLFEILDFTSTSFLPSFLPVLFRPKSSLLGRDSSVTFARSLAQGREGMRSRVASFLPLSDSFVFPPRALRVAESLAVGGVDVNHARTDGGRKCVKDPQYLACFPSLPSFLRLLVVRCS